MSSMALRVGGQTFAHWTHMRVGRDLRDLAGRFEFELIDDARAAATLPAMAGSAPGVALIDAGQPVRITIEDEVILVGWIDEMEVEMDGGRLRARVCGRDRTGDLVDCAAAPAGPVEYRNLDLVAIASAICAPFGVSVRADVDVGPPFTVFGIDAAETALSAIEKAARQRAVLPVSDGVGGLLLTRAGSTRAPDRLLLPGNVQRVSARNSWHERYSDYWVKGQTRSDRRHARGGGAASPHLDATLAPNTAPAPPGGGAAAQSVQVAVPRPTAGTADPPVTVLPTVTVTAPRPGPATASNPERPAIVMTGHAVDPEITRYRPRVWLTRTQSGAASAQDQADWRMRTHRGLAEHVCYEVIEWRAGPVQPNGLAALWRPNALVAVTDPWSNVNGDQLIEGVEFSSGPDGHRTLLRVVGPDAYARIAEASPHARRPHGTHRGNVTTG